MDYLIYRRMVRTFAKRGDLIVADLTPANAHLWHMATGVSGEAGELLDAVKKTAIYNKTIDRENIIEELGDLEFYMQGLRDALGISRDETLRSNYEKLSNRYHLGGYTNAQAQERADKAAGS
jgi:NTP pyrophosphatase (non-canonical NTP hydrolase)